MLKAVAGGIVPITGGFTPALQNIGTGTYTTQSGTYALHGDQVNCEIQIDINALGTASGNLIITGLPFVANNPSRANTSAIFATGFSVTAANMVGVIISSTATLELYKDSGTAAIANMTHADMGTGLVRFSVEYKVA